MHVAVNFLFVLLTSVADTGGFAMVSSEIPSKNKAHARNQFTEWAQVGETT